MNDYNNEAEVYAGPASRAISVTTHNTNRLTNMSRALYVGTAGDIRVRMLSGEIITFKNVQGWLPIRVIQVFTTGTTASDIVAVW